MITTRNPAAEESSVVSHAQEMLWCLDRALPDAGAYNVPIAWRVSGTIDRAALRWAVDRLAERHDQLRTAFPAVDGRPVSRTSAEVFIPIRELTCDRDAAIDELTRDEVRRPFDLAEAPLFRVLVVRGVEESALVFTFHPIVCDGSSRGVVHDDFFTLYAARCEGREAALPPIPARYAEFALAVREAEANGAHDASLAWWTQHLRDLPRFELIGDRRPPASRTVCAGRISRRLDSETLRGVRSFARDHRMTTFATLLTAYVALLASYSRADEVVLGVPASGRAREELERVVGNFTEMVALRVRVDPARRFADLAGAAHTELVDALTNSVAPLQQVVERVAPERSQTNNPLFSVAIVESRALAEVVAGGARFRTRPVDTLTAKFDLLLEVTEDRDELTITLEYGSDRFEPASAELLIDAYRRILARAVRDPDSALEGLPAAESESRAAAELPIVDPAGSAASAALVHRRFRAHAQRTPNVIALWDGERSLSYAEVMRAADAIRSSLLANGVRTGTLVGLCAERSAELIAAIIAILDAGGAYVPLDPQYPAERLRSIAQDSGLELIVADRASLDVVREIGKERVVLEEALRREPAATEPAAVAGSDAAYVIYTSGSTGRPKGVVVEHANVARLFTIAERRFAFRSDDVWTLFHSYAFDFSVWEIWGALAHGGQLVVVPWALARAPHGVHRLVADRGVTVFNQTPSAFYEFAAADAATPLPLRLRYIILGGEAVDPGRLAEWFRRRGEHVPRIVNMYGITETTVHVTYHELRSSDSAAALGPIGVPLDDLAIVLRDARGCPVPAGFVGEMYVLGAGVARGYLNDAATTEARFGAVPGGGASGRSYRTGDLARRRPDGTYEYVGRADQQVKIRGFRIEPAEIEAALSRHPKVARSVVLPETSNGEVRLVAYVVPCEESPDLHDLHAHLGAVLPPYMIPSAFVPVRTIPLTENGKLDRRALAALAIPARPALAEREPEVVSALQAQIASLFQEVLRVTSVALDDNFFALGGHSLLAARLVARVQTTFPSATERLGAQDGRNALLRAFYREPTVRAIAFALEGNPDVHGSVVSLRKGNSARTPVFWFHGLYNRDGLYAWNILTAIPDIVPFYVVEPHGYGNESFPADIGRLTEDRLAEIRRACPHGPYIIGGFCNGAVMAFEAARRLRAVGEVVENLVLVAPAPLVPFGSWLTGAAHSIGRRLGLGEDARIGTASVLRSMFRNGERFVRGTARQRGAILRKIPRRLFGGAFADAGVDVDTPEALRPLAYRYAAAIMNYRPQRYEGRAEIIYGRDNVVELASPDGGWAPHVSDPHVHDVSEPLLGIVSGREIGEIMSRAMH